MPSMVSVERMQSRISDCQPCEMSSFRYIFAACERSLATNQKQTHGLRGKHPTLLKYSRTASRVVVVFIRGPRNYIYEMWMSPDPVRTRSNGPPPRTLPRICRWVSFTRPCTVISIGEFTSIVPELVEMSASKAESAGSRTCTLPEPV